MRKIKPEHWINLVLAGMLAGLILFIYCLDPHFFGRLWQVMISGNMQETIDFIASFGIWAIVFSFFLDVLVNALGFLPSIFISTANGVLFGLPVGILVSWLAETVGVVVSFLLMRGLLRSSAEKLIARSSALKRMDDFSGKNGLQMMLIARAMPYFPSGILTALGALSSISLRDYVIANLVGKFPSTALEVVIGHDVVNYEKNLGRLTIVVLGSAAVYAGIWWYQRKKMRTGK